MNCDEAKLDFQMLVDNELEEEKITSLMEHIKSCYNCRKEYISLLKLQRRLNSIKGGVPEEEWFEALEKAGARKLFKKTGLFLLIFSWLVLFAFAMLTFFKDSNENNFVKIAVAISIFSVITLFTITVIDRRKEAKTDKYKDVIK